MNSTAQSASDVTSSSAPPPRTENHSSAISTGEIFYKFIGYFTAFKYSYLLLLVFHHNHSRRYTFLFCKSFPPVSLHGFPQTAYCLFLAYPSLLFTFFLFNTF